MVGRTVGTAVGASVGVAVVGARDGDTVGCTVGAVVGVCDATQLVFVSRTNPARHSHSMTPPPRSAQYVEAGSQP